MNGPWDLVGWMIVGAVGGLAVKAVAEGIGDTFREIHRAFGWKAIAGLFGLTAFIALWLFAPRWMFILAVMFAVMLTTVAFMGRKSVASAESERGL